MNAGELEAWELTDEAAQGGLTHGGTVTNMAGGNISGLNAGIATPFQPTYKTQINVTNAGLIQGTGVGSSGVYLSFGGNVTNQAGGVASATLLIAAMGGDGDVPADAHEGAREWLWDHAAIPGL